MSAPYQPSAERSFEELEAIVDRGLQSFIEVGEALMEIRAKKLYLKTHATFRDYCEQRWGFSDSRGRQLIAAAKTVTAVTLAGGPAPKTEGEARRIARELRGLERHPFVRDLHERGLFPDIEGAAWEQFKASIAKWGCIAPITLYEGYILDGWQRYRACLEVGVTPEYTVYEGDAPKQLFAGLHLLRKHYTSDEIAKAMQ